MKRPRSRALHASQLAVGTALFAGGTALFVTSEMPTGELTRGLFLARHALHVFGGGFVMTAGVWVFALGLRGLRALKPFDLDRAAADVELLSRKSRFGRVMVPQVASELSLSPDQAERLLRWMETKGRCRQERVEGWEVFVFDA